MNEPYFGGEGVLKYVGSKKMWGGIKSYMDLRINREHSLNLERAQDIKIDHRIS